MSFDDAFTHVGALPVIQFTHHIPVVVVVVVIVVVVVHVHAQHLSSAMIIHKNNKMLTRWLLENGERQTKKDGFLSSFFSPFRNAFVRQPRNRQATRQRQQQTQQQSMFCVFNVVLGYR